MAQAQGLLTGARSAAAVFAFALAVRFVYLALVYGGTPSISHIDSAMWLDLAAGPGFWAGTHERMPLYPWFLRAVGAIAGSATPLAAVAVQMAIDAAACVAILRIAEAIRPGSGIWAGAFAAVNPTQIVMAGVLLGDSIFMAQLAFGLAGLANWWKAGAPARVREGLVPGLWFGSALLNRALIWPFAPVLALLLFVAARARGARGLEACRVPAVVLALIALSAVPPLARNAVVHERWSLSSQGGAHTALWVYPLVKEAADGTPYWRTFERVREIYTERAGPDGEVDPFVSSAIYGRIGREGLAEIGLDGIIKAWAMGAAINLASPATLMIPPVMALPRTGFYATHGATPIDKALNFLTDSSSSGYLLWLGMGVAVEWPVRLLALAGLLVALLARGARAPTILALAWIGFVLAVHGPIASAKYRLPIEPLAMVFAGYALASWRARGVQRR